jgi:hypothetical protein
MSDILGKYSFLPWLRRGIAAKIKQPEVFGIATGSPDSRATYSVKVKINNDIGGETAVPKDLEIVGPGDVVGIDSRAILKTEPHNWITNFEPHLFPFIEFYEEDFPWRFTPAAPVGKKLRPWITLIVLKESEFTRGDVLAGPLPRINVGAGADSTLFPNPAQTWAWSHIQFNGFLDTTTDSSMDPYLQADVNTALNRFVQEVAANPDKAYSRILCPRRLESNTSYYAFLIPAFETGRLAGLGVDDVDINAVEAQKPSFGSPHTAENNTFPVYHEWFFKTGATGDFEYLVRQIIPRVVDSRVGKRLMDVQNPGYNVSFAGVPPNSGTQYLEGALRAPLTVSMSYAAWKASAGQYFNRMRDLLNLAEDLNDAAFGSSFYALNPFYSGSTSIEDDPIVAPPIYGRWHALRRRVEGATLSPNPDLPKAPNAWLNELNMDPRNRVPAGLGTEYVRKNQDLLMDKAWEQLGEVLEANRQLRWAQMAQQSSARLFGKHIKPQGQEQNVGLTAKMQRKVKDSPTSTQWKTTARSAQPLATLDHAYRRIQRPNGPTLRKVDPTSALHTDNNLVTRLANKNIPTVEPVAVSTQQNFVTALDVRSDINTVRSASSVVFRVSAPGTGAYTGDSAEQADFLAAVEPYKNYFLPANWAPFDSGPMLDTATVEAEMNTGLDPIFTIPKAVYAQLQLPGPPPPPDKIYPVMAYPILDRPMYESVRDQGVDYLVPNLNLIPNNSITLLETNQKFIESFMVGANHEMGRELLWREFPTDQRGSYFRRFWDSSDYVDTQGRSPEDIALETYDIDEIHKWVSNTPLGSHDFRADNDDTTKMVLVIRGDLLKKFPNTVIYAQKAKYRLAPDLEPVLELPRLLDDEFLFPIFSAKVEPDITFIGFNLTTEEAKGDRNLASMPGWFFIIKERPGETRFGIDEPTTGHVATPATWSDLDWQHIQDAASVASAPEFGPTFPSFPLGGAYIDLKKVISPGNDEINDTSITWAENSANMAMIFYQQPVLVAIHANEMIP